MDIDVNKLSAVLFGSAKNVEFMNQLNLMLRYMIDRDVAFVSSKGSAPQAWECKWLNQDKVSGYQKGSTVWMNVSTYEQLLNTSRQVIESYVINNPELNAMYRAIDQNDTVAQNRFLLKAAKGEASSNVSAIYCLGDVADKVQIRISTVDNNKTYPTDSTCWKDFYVHQSYDENVQKLSSAAEQSIKDALVDHLSAYHKVGLTEAELKSQGFFQANPFNPDNVEQQDFFDHNYCDRMDGFDYVKRWKMTSDGSSWCKIWNSGYVEQGGFVDNIQGQALIQVLFPTKYNYPLGPAFYQRDYQSYNRYPISSSIQSSNRYVATVTPILKDGSKPYPDHPMPIGNELVYTAVDMTDMSNTGFSIVNTDMDGDRYSKYSWHACGYKVIESDNDMFDGGYVDNAAPDSVFDVVDYTLVDYDDSGKYSTIVVPNVTKIADGVFNGNNDIVNVILPSNLQHIGASAFNDCDSIQGITIPAKVTSISANAFSNCDSLAYVGMGSNVNFVGVSAFCNDPNLRTITRFNDTNPSHTFDKVCDYAFYGIPVKKLNLSLRSAGIDNFWGDYCFADCKQLEEVNILSACYMSTGMFKGCTSLKAVNFKNGNTNYMYPNVFEGCSSLTSITFPPQIWYISEEMFKDCISLKTVKFSEYNSSKGMFNLIQRNAFNGCSSLQSIELPASLTSLDQLDDACLSNCSLTSITFHGISRSDIELLSAFLDKNGMFRLDHDCIIQSKSGDILQFSYDKSKEETYHAPIVYESITGNVTISVANAVPSAMYECPWYYDSEKVYDTAYQNKKPCLFIYSLLGCKPCQVYSQKIFNNNKFQEWARQQKFYLCGIEANKQPMFDESLNYCKNSILSGALNLAREDEQQQLSDVQPNAMGEKYMRFKVDNDLTNSNLTTPVMLFNYYNGSVETTWAYSLHNIDKYIDLWGSVDKVIDWIASLCLYHFDGNSKTNAKFVVGAEPFVRAKYPTSAQPQPQPDNYVVTPESNNGIQLTSVADVNNDIISRVGPTYVNNGKPYLINCAFESVPYLNDTFKGIDSCMTISATNDLIESGNNAKYKFKIGSKYYKFSLSTTDFYEVNTCTDLGNAVAGAPMWTEIII